MVQRLVPAGAAGILFTADPISGQRDRVLISASWGLGEAVVGCGNATMLLKTGDRVRVDGRRGTVEILTAEFGQNKNRL